MVPPRGTTRHDGRELVDFEEVHRRLKLRLSRVILEVQTKMCVRVKKLYPVVNTVLAKQGSEHVRHLPEVSHTDVVVDVPALGDVVQGGDSVGRHFLQEVEREGE